MNYGATPCKLPSVTANQKALPAPVADTPQAGEPETRGPAPSSPAPGGRRTQITVKSPAPRKPATDTERDAADDPQSGPWFCAVACGRFKVGDEIGMQKLEHVKLGKLAIFRAGGGEGVAIQASTEEVHDKLKEFQVSASCPAPSPEVRPAEVETRPLPQPGVSQGTLSDAIEEDVRVLQISLDGALERFKSIDEACTQYTEEGAADWPVDGHKSTLHTLRQLRRANQMFLQQHVAWKRDSNIRTNDRAVHEHYSLSRALHFGQYYDQVNMPNLAMVEAMIKRRALIERAYKLGSADAPNYVGGDHFQGIRESADSSIIDPAAHKYAADRLHAEYEVARNSRLAYTERGRQPAFLEGDEFPTGPPAPPTRPTKPPKGQSKGDQDPKAK